MNGSRSPFRLGVPLAVVGTFALFLFGCGTVDEGGGEGGYTEVYGDYGYTGPWPYNTFEADGYVHTRPPFDRFDGDPHPAPAPGHPVGPARPPEPGRGTAPVHNNPRPPPSIPNRPRPSGGGGGGGHPSGGGGGSHSSGGGGKK